MRRSAFGPEGGVFPPPKVFHDDILWDIYIMITSGRPLSQCFDKIYEALAAVNSSSCSNFHLRDHLSQHSAQSVVWTHAGKWAYIEAFVSELVDRL